MRVEIIPSLTVGSVRTFESGLKRLETFAPMIHVDLMDGQFVATRSISPAQIALQKFHRPIEAHLMVSKPADWLSALSRLPLRRVILHVELGQGLLPILAWFRARRISITLAINSQTPLKSLWRWLPHIQGVQVMGVKPGRYGAPFHPQALVRLSELHRRNPRLRLACDGGVNAKTLPRVVAAGARRVVIGSAIQRATHPAAEYRRLQVIARSQPAVVH